MGYEIYTDHPESQERRDADFTSWSFWARDNAPWTGVSVSEVAAMLKEVCPRPELAAICAALDQGGHLSREQAQTVLRLAAEGMSADVRRVFEAAVAAGYGVRVVYSSGAFGALSASAYLEKASGSA